MMFVITSYSIHYTKLYEIIGKETGQVLEKGDKVRARIVAVSLKEEKKRGSKIALTMRQDGLGNLQWLEEPAKKKKKEN